MFLLKKKKLLVIAPHPDDEVIGCAGLIQKVKQGGGSVFVQFLTNGTTRDFSRKGASTISERDREIARVMSFLKVDKYLVAFADDDFHLKLDKHGRHPVMQLIERDSPISIQKVRPDIVAFPSLYGYNQDHRLAAYAVHASLRPAEFGKHFVPIILAYEMPMDEWSLDEKRQPNFFIKLTAKEVKIKLKSMELYKSQMRPPPNLRSLPTLEAFAKLRGSLIGSDFAEAYHIYRLAI